MLRAGLEKLLSKQRIKSNEMSRWIDASDADRQQSAYIIANEKNISVGAVEKTGGLLPF